MEEPHRPINRWKGATFVLGALVIFLSLLALPACCCRTAGPREAGVPRPSPEPPIGSVPFQTPAAAASTAETQVEMHNVFFHEDATLVLRLHQLRGRMFDRVKGQPLNLDNKKSFILVIDQARVGIDGASLSDLINHYAFGYSGAPLRDLRITMAGQQLRQEGILHKVIDIPFVMYADPTLTSDGRIRIHPTRIQICSLNGAALLKAFGLTLQKLIDVSRARGVTLEGNDLILDPLKILPPPEIQGRLSSVKVEGEEFMQLFDSGHPAAPLHPPSPEEPNWMYFREGTVRLGRLFFVDADLQVVDADPADPFDFFLDHYNDQLVAGFSRNRNDYGLTAFMRDYSDLGQPPRPGERLAPSPR